MLFKNQRKQILQLSKKKQRLANGLFVAEGEKVVRELLNFSWVYESLYTTDPLFHTNAEVIRMEEMKQLTHFKTPSPVLGVFKMPPRKEILNESISIVLDGISDPGSDLAQTLKELNKPIYGATASGNSLYNTSLPKKATFVFGSESHGISDKLNPHLDEELAIPHFKLSENRAESLNVATAGAIFLSEIFRSGGSIQK